MTINDLKSKLAREPFRPFIINLSSGRRVPFSEASAVLLMAAELVIAFSDEGRSTNCLRHRIPDRSMKATFLRSKPLPPMAPDTAQASGIICRAAS
jgi:hypothetical protein